MNVLSTESRSLFLQREESPNTLRFYTEEIWVVDNANRHSSNAIDRESATETILTPPWRGKR